MRGERVGSFRMLCGNLPFTGGVGDRIGREPRVDPGVGAALAFGSGLAAHEQKKTMVSFIDSSSVACRMLVGTLRAAIASADLQESAGPSYANLRPQHHSVLTVLMPSIGLISPTNCKRSVIVKVPGTFDGSSGFQSLPFSQR